MREAIITALERRLERIENKQDDQIKAVVQSQTEITGLKKEVETMNVTLTKVNNDFHYLRSKVILLSTMVSSLSAIGYEWFKKKV